MRETMEDVIDELGWQDRPLDGMLMSKKQMLKLIGRLEDYNTYLAGELTVTLDRVDELQSGLETFWECWDKTRSAAKAVRWISESHRDERDRQLQSGIDTFWEYWEQTCSAAKDVRAAK